MSYQAPSRATPESHQRKADKLARIPIKVEQPETKLRKPDWIRIKIGDGAEIIRVKQLLRQHNLHTVCEEAACPNLAECFQHGTATFMIMGDLCTRRCPFCDVAHGKPLPLDKDEPLNLAQAIKALALKYVVITSVDRDDLRDGGAGHFADCIRLIRQQTPNTKIEILVPDFRGRIDKAINILANEPCDVFNHNLETVPRLYKQVRPRFRLSRFIKFVEEIQPGTTQHPHQVRINAGRGRRKSRSYRSYARSARPRLLHANTRSISTAQQRSFTSVSLYHAC